MCCVHKWERARFDGLKGLNNSVVVSPTDKLSVLMSRLWQTAEVQRLLLVMWNLYQARSLFSRVMFQD